MQDSPRCVDITRTRPYIERYQYDAVGNLEELRHQISGGGFRRVFDLVPGTNQLARVTANGNTFDFAFDENGNLTGEGLSRHMEWDHSDRLRTYRTQMGNSEPSVYTHYLYDSSGRRVKKITRKQGGRLEISVYIDDMLEYRRDQDGGSVIENNILHIMDSEKRVALLRVGSAFPGDSGPATQYHLGDHLSSSNLVINDSGAWINREEFTPYGETSFGSFAQKRYRFTGKERDEESGLYYHFRRYYAPWLGRWMSCDPNQMANGMNLYAYVYGNPMGLTDEQGTNEEELSAEEIAAGVCDPELNANHCEIPDENLGMDYPQSIPAPETSAPAPLRSSSESPVRSETDVGPDAFCPLDMAQSTPESFPSLEEIVGSCDPADQCCPESAPAPETGTERLPTTPPSSDQPRSDPNIMMSTEGSSAGGPDPLDPAGPGGHDQPRPETEEKHEEGEGRRRRDRGRESGDRRRRAPRRRPDGWQGPWPPPVWPPPEESSETETSSSRVGFWLGVGLIVVGSVVIVATIAEDFFTLGGGLADDPVTMTAGGAMISRGAGGL